MIFVDYFLIILSIWDVLNKVNKYIISGFIPIIDLESFPNIFNKLNASLISKFSWELFF